MDLLALLVRLLPLAYLALLLAATGIVDFDAVDGWLTTDGDTAEPNVVAGMVARLGLSGVPMMLVLTVLSFFGWLITYFVHLFLLQHLPDGLRWIGGAGTLIVALLPGALVTSLLLRPRGWTCSSTTRAERCTRRWCHTSRYMHGS